VPTGGRGVARVGGIGVASYTYIYYLDDSLEVEPYYPYYGYYVGDWRPGGRFRKGGNLATALLRVATGIP
jgi:hypothetical protein